jgi:hypothetical protein
MCTYVCKQPSLLLSNKRLCKTVQHSLTQSTCCHVQQSLLEDLPLHYASRQVRLEQHWIRLLVDI